MSLYAVALFLHVLGAFGIFTAMCLELALLLRIRQAETAQQISDWINLLRAIRDIGAITGRSLPGIARDLANHVGPISVDLHERLRHPLPLASIQVRIAMVLGIVFLMTTKPDMTLSIGAIVVAAGLGAAFSIPAINRTGMARNEAAR